MNGSPTPWILRNQYQQQNHLIHTKWINESRFYRGFFCCCFFLQLNKMSMNKSCWIVSTLYFTLFQSKQGLLPLGGKRLLFKIISNRGLDEESCVARCVFTLLLNICIASQSRKKKPGREFQSLVVWGKKLLE